MTAALGRDLALYGTEGGVRWRTPLDSRLAALRLQGGTRRVTWLANLTADKQDLPENCAHAAFALLDADSVGTARHDADFLQKPQPATLTRVTPYAVARPIGGPV